MTWLSHILDCELFGIEPFWHHLTNLLFHTANTLLLFWVFKRMTGAIWPSAFVAAAFALHPLHVESVAWASERKDVLSVLFWMLTMIAYLWYARRGGVARYLLVLLFLCLGLMAKPMLVTLPFVLLLLDYWPLGRFRCEQTAAGLDLPQAESADAGCRSSSTRHLIIEKIPLLVVVMISCIITLHFQKVAGAVKQEDMPLNIRMANALISYAKYVGKMVYPSRLAVLYPLPVGSLPKWQIFVSFIIVVCISACVFYIGRRHRYLAVGWLWYLGTLVPVIGLVRVGSQAMADRYTYLPSIGIFVMVAWGADELLSGWRYKKTVLGIIAGVMIAVLLICTRKQVSHWQNSSTLFEHTIAVTENNYIIHKNYGNVLYEQGQLDEAVRHYKEALRIAPLYLAARLKMGMVLVDQEKFDEAVECFNELLQIKPDCPDAHFYLALVFFRQGKYEQAIQNYKQELQARPDFVDAHINLGSALTRVGNLEQAVKHYTEALQLMPDRIDIINNLGRILATAEDEKLRNPAEAVKLAGRACELTKYQQPELLDTLAAAYAAEGRFSEAIETSEKAVTLAKEAGRDELAEEIQNRLELYKAGQPYIEGPTEQDNVNP